MDGGQPGRRSKEELKQIVGSIILSQGNDFIKELLRQNKIPIGTTKPEFGRNLSQAIDSGALSQAMIEDWLGDVEGWGNQHVYLYRSLPMTARAIRTRIGASRFAGLLAHKVSYEFPEALQLTSISLDADRLSLVWHIGSAGWERVKPMDRFEEVGLDFYKFEAYRRRAERNLVRFEWRFADPYCAILIELANRDSQHDEAIAQVRSHLGEIGIAARLDAVSLSQAAKRASADPKLVALSARMTAEGGHVDFVSTLLEGGIGDVEAVRHVRNAVNESEFHAAEGLFHFTTKSHPALSRAIKVQVFGRESRMRLWAQCKRDDVYLIIDALWASNQVS
ncbi:MAG: hypothetical protein J0H01_14665 [Rhizobiales bacterium]|nr:hypothetical protein [Hyphomicrobiales bacterium]